MTLTFIPTKMEDSEQRNGTYFNLVTLSAVLSPFLARGVLPLSQLTWLCAYHVPELLCTLSHLILVLDFIISILF